MNMIDSQPALGAHGHVSLLREQDTEVRTETDAVGKFPLYAAAIAREGELVAWVPGGEGRYLVTSFGYVYTLRGRGNYYLSCPQPLRSHDHSGHLHVTCRFKGKRTVTSIRIARLVLSVFVREPRGKEQALHKEKPATNNRVDNLYWGSAYCNMKDQYKEGTRNTKRTLTDEDVRAIYLSTLLPAKLASLYGTSIHTVGNIQRNHRRTSVTKPLRCMAPKRRMKAP